MSLVIVYCYSQWQWISNPQGQWLTNSTITWLLKIVGTLSRQHVPEHCCLSLNNLGEERCFFLSFFQGGVFFLLRAVFECLEYCERAASFSQEDKRNLNTLLYWNSSCVLTKQFLTKLVIKAPILARLKTHAGRELVVVLHHTTFISFPKCKSK